MDRPWGNPWPGSAAPAAAREAHGATGAGGFTLLELITVLGVIALLSGIGVGFLTKTENDMDIALAAVRDKVRLAYETARSRGRPTSVELRKVYDGQQNYLGQVVTAKVLATVGQWHLEPNEQQRDELTPLLLGIPVESGRYGYAMRPDPDSDGALFSLATDKKPQFGLRDGFALRLELRLTSRRRCVVASMGSAFTLELDEDARPRASMFLALPGPRRGPQVSLDLKDAEVPVGRWSTLDLIHDGRTLRLMIDGEVVGSQSAEGEPFQDGEPFLVSPPQGPVPGLVDEIQLLAYERDEPSEVPATVTVEGLATPLAYDRRGRLERPVTLEFTLDQQKRRRVVAPGGVLR